MNTLFASLSLSTMVAGVVGGLVGAFLVWIIPVPRFEKNRRWWGGLTAAVNSAPSKTEDPGAAVSHDEFVAVTHHGEGVTHRGDVVVYHFASGNITLTREEDEQLKKRAREIARKTFPALAS